MREDWVECELGVPFNITYGKGLPTKKLINEGYPVFGANGIIGYYSEYKYTKEQVLISCRGAASGTINISPEKCYITNNSLIVETKDSNNILKKYLYYMLKASNRSKIITGTAQPQVTINNAKTLLIPIAPLPEQRAIVAKIEALFSDLDNGIADLKKAQEQLKIYRQAVLKKAFEGELTRKWRALRQAQGPPLPAAEELLEQIKDEREKHYNKQVEEWKQDVNEWEKNGKQGKKPGKPHLLSKLIYEFKEKILNIPREWNEGSLEYIANAIDPQPSHRTPPAVDDGIPYISIADIDKTTGMINFDKARKVGDHILAEHIGRYNLNYGDFVIGKIGTIGKPFYIPTDRFFTLSANVVLVQPNTKSCVSKYLFYLNISPIIEQQFKSGSKATTQAAFGIKKVRLLRIPLCSLEEQHQIVREIETRLSVCDKLEQSITEALEKADALRQSILKKAFQGNLLNEAELKLCREAPDYEPAGLLLSRIKQSSNKITGAENGGN